MSAIGADIGGRPSVSVVIPMRDASATITCALESLRAQAGVPWEAVVVDDGSTDESADIVGAIAAHDARVRLVRRAWRGLAWARNEGIESSLGRWLVFLDADDWLLPGALGRLIEGASATGAAYGGAAWHDDAGANLGWSFAPSCPSVGIDELLHSARFAPAGQILARELLGAERFGPDHPGVEDLDLWLRLASRGVRWTAIDGDACGYRLRARSMSRDFGRMAAGHCGAVQAGFALAAERGWPGLGVDCSRERRVRVVERIALEYATAEAHSDPWPDHRRAARLLAAHGPGARIDASAAASAAWWMLPYAACLAPNVWERDDAVTGGLVRAAVRWWRAIEARGIGAPDLPAAALGALAELAVPMEQVARAIVDECTGAHRVVVLGLGRNGRHVVRALRRRGIKFAVRDNAVHGASAEIDGAPVPVLPADAPFDPRVHYLITVGDDGRIMAQLPRGLEVRRWSAVRAELSSRAHARLLALAAGVPCREAAA